MYLTRQKKLPKSDKNTVSSNYSFIVYFSFLDNRGDNEKTTTSTASLRIVFPFAIHRRARIKIKFLFMYHFPNLQHPKNSERPVARSMYALFFFLLNFFFVTRSNTFPRFNNLRWLGPVTFERDSYNRIYEFTCTVDAADKPRTVYLGERQRSLYVETDDSVWIYICRYPIARSRDVIINYHGKQIRRTFLLWDGSCLIRTAVGEFFRFFRFVCFFFLITTRRR